MLPVLRNIGWPELTGRSGARVCEEAQTLLSEFDALWWAEGTTLVTCLSRVSAGIYDNRPLARFQPVRPAPLWCSDIGWQMSTCPHSLQRC